MRVLLVNMPWASLQVPSLALGILSRAVTSRMPDVEIEVMHANIDYVDWLTKRREFTLDDYEYYSLHSYFSGAGDWVFSSALYDDPDWRRDEFLARMSGQADEASLTTSLRLHELAPEFIGELAERIVAWGPDVVGFTTTFQQNAASLAAARQIKRLAPDIVTIFGGANCDGAQGEALHRNFRFVDFALRGEGEASFPAFLHALGAEQALRSVPGLCWRDAGGAEVVNPMSTRPLPPAEIVRPAYTGYFERLAASAAGTWAEPKLVVEGARGCWWGEKHHCTFCGLNGSFMEFRSKPPADFYDEIVEMVRRYQVLDFYLVDNILDMGYVTTLLPRLVDSGYDLRVFCEIKANMRRDQLDTLYRSGLVHVQPGIENLNSRVLKLMDKGVTGCQNVRMLRDGESTGLAVSWNYLYGFPGETPADYDPVIEQMAVLHHLAPPAGMARIEIERFSPYFNKPELGFTDLRPAAQYAMTYDLPEAELFDFAYVFATTPRGIGPDTAARLGEALVLWQDAYPAARLTSCDLGDRIVLVNRRQGFGWTELCLDDELSLAAFGLLDQPHTIESLARKLGTPESTVESLLIRWCGLGIVFTDGGQFVHVVPVNTNQDILRKDAER